MTDLERLEEAWPLGWRESGDYEGWDVEVGPGTLQVSIVHGDWHFWSDTVDPFDSVLIGEGDLQSAARQAVEYLKDYAEEIAKRGTSVEVVIAAFAERSEA